MVFADNLSHRRYIEHRVVGSERLSIDAPPLKIAALREFGAEAL